MIDNQGSAMQRVLLLGGTTEASLLARSLAEADVPAVFSYAGRTAEPVAQPLPVRVGGFGSVEGLVAWLQAEGISHVVDATHPFAAGMSHNAAEACRKLALPLAALERPAWVAQPGDRWAHVADMDAAARALPLDPARVFLAIGRQNLQAFAGTPHHYLLRLVDPPEAPPLPRCEVVIARGPFAAADDLAMLRAHQIQIVVAKNAGGVGAEAKLTAARQLGLQVILIDRPGLPDRPSFATVGQVMAWLGHPANLGV